MMDQVKDNLDLFIRSRSEDLERLHVLESPLRKLADTLGMVGMGNLRQKLKRQAERIADLQGRDYSIHVHVFDDQGLARLPAWTERNLGTAWHTELFVRAD